MNERQDNASHECNKGRREGGRERGKWGLGGWREEGKQSGMLRGRGRREGERKGEGEWRGW